MSVISQFFKNCKVNKKMFGMVWNLMKLWAVSENVDNVSVTTSLYSYMCDMPFMACCFYLSYMYGDFFHETYFGTLYILRGEEVSLF